MGNRVKEKLGLIAEDHVMRAQLVKMVFRIKEKVALIAGDHVMRAQLVKMVFRIKEKLALIAEAHVLQTAMVLRSCCDDMNIVKKMLCFAVEYQSNINFRCSV